MVFASAITNPPQQNRPALPATANYIQLYSWRGFNAPPFWGVHKVLNTNPMPYENNHTPLNLRFETEDSSDLRSELCLPRMNGFLGLLILPKENLYTNYPVL
jgi:hypothetical protein